MVGYEALITTIAGGVIGFLTSLWFGWRDKIRRAVLLRYSVVTSPVLSRRIGLEDLKVTFKDKEVENIWATEITFWNAGRTKINLDHFVKTVSTLGESAGVEQVSRLMLSISGNGQVLGWSIEKFDVAEGDLINSDFVVYNDENSSGEINFLIQHLLPQAGFKLALLHSDSTISINANVKFKDMKDKLELINRFSSGIEPKNRRFFNFLSLFLLFFSILALTLSLIDLSSGFTGYGENLASTVLYYSGPEYFRTILPTPSDAIQLLNLGILLGAFGSILRWVLAAAAPIPTSSKP